MKKSFQWKSQKEVGGMGPQNLYLEEPLPE